MQKSKQFILLLILLLNGGSIGYALYARLILHVETCVLCNIQFCIVAAISILTIAALLISFYRICIKLILSMMSILSLCGIMFAIKQLVLLETPSGSVCSMPLAAVWHNLQFSQFISSIVNGNSQCDSIMWTIFGIYPPHLVIILCIATIVLSVIYVE